VLALVLQTGREAKVCRTFPKVLLGEDEAPVAVDECRKPARWMRAAASPPPVSPVSTTRPRSRARPWRVADNRKPYAPPGGRHAPRERFFDMGEVDDASEMPRTLTYSEPGASRGSGARYSRISLFSYSPGERCRAKWCRGAWRGPARLLTAARDAVASISKT
jgi:hypothetical protein